MIVYRVCDSRFPFLWTVSDTLRQLPARWHGVGEGPVQYFADTPTGAWAELLRHEEITAPADLAGISARLWAVRIGHVEMCEPSLPLAALTSAPEGYEVCRAEARRLRAAGAVRLVTISAALQPGEAAGFHVGKAGLVRAAPKNGKVVVHFGLLADAEGWCTADAAHPEAGLLRSIRPLHPV